MANEFSRNNFRVTPKAELVPIQVAGSSTFGRYSKIASGLTYNMFISDSWLVNFAGYKRVIEMIADNVGEGRGLFHSARGDILIAVIGSIVFQITSDLNYSQIGILTTSSGEVFIDENLNNQICIVDGARAYIYNYKTVTGIVPQTSVTFNPSYVCFHNTYFLFGNNSRENVGAFWYAYVYDAADTSGASIKQQTQLALSTKPDFAIAVTRLPGQANNVLVFGTGVCEIWTQVGGLENYRRNSSVNIDYGCRSVSTIAANDQYTAWLGANENNSPVIMVYSQSSGLTRISTDGIDYLLDSIRFPEDSTAMFYKQDGHLFYHITFFNPADNLTLVYDFNTQKFFNLSDQGGDYHPARSMVYFNNAPYFISLNNASLYVTNTNLTTYNENLGNDPALFNSEINYEIPRTRICESISKPDSGRFVANSFVLTMAQGDDPYTTGADLAPGSQDDIITESGSPIVTQTGNQMITQNSSTGGGSYPYFNNNLTTVYRPRIDMAISKDGGTTWSNYVARALNPIGKRKNIITWNNMGVANDLTIKLRFNTVSNIVCSDGLVEIY